MHPLSPMMRTVLQQIQTANFSEQIQKPVVMKEPRGNTIFAMNRYRKALEQIGRPATAIEIADKLGFDRHAIFRFDAKNPGFFKKTEYRVPSGQKALLYWIGEEVK